MNKKLSFSIWYIILAIWAVILVQDFIHALQKIEELPYSEFKTQGKGRRGRSEQPNTHRQAQAGADPGHQLQRGRDRGGEEGPA